MVMCVQLNWVSMLSRRTGLVLLALLAAGIVGMLLLGPDILSKLEGSPVHNECQPMPLFVDFSKAASETERKNVFSLLGVAPPVDLSGKNEFYFSEFTQQTFTLESVSSIQGLPYLTIMYVPCATGASAR